MATNTYVAIETQTLTSNVASVTLGSGGTIPQTYSDLVLVINSGQVTADGFYAVRFNGDTTNNYSNTQIVGNGSTATSNRNTSQTVGYIHSTAQGTVADVVIAHIMNYSNSTTFKTVISRGNSFGYRSVASAVVWRKTPEPITSMTISGASNLLSGSTFTLYGIANSNIGAPKAFGGTITQDATHTYHTFGASGTFTPQQSLTADVLVVAGGGGGGRIVGGGGGAGGLLGFASQSLTATGYTVTVGSGGVGAATSAYNSGTVGGDSQFGALTLVKGGGYGGGLGIAGGAGGSGGGGGGTNSDVAGGAASPSGQGNAGGTTDSAARTYEGAGGGGAGAAGGRNTSTVGGPGGVGSSAYSSWGLTTGTGQNVAGVIYYAGGGGGGWSNPGSTTASIGLGGFGGGGNGGWTNPSVDNAGTAGLVNTGGGGGGAPNDYTGANATTYGKNGGSGIVIIRYAN